MAIQRRNGAKGRTPEASAPSARIDKESDEVIHLSDDDDLEQPMADEDSPPAEDEEESLPMFPPPETIVDTFKKEDGQSMAFFVLPPNGQFQEKEYAGITEMIPKGGGTLVQNPSEDTYNICYNESTLISREYLGYNRWFTADLIRRCMDCQSFDDDIVGSEMITAPNFQKEVIEESNPHEKNWCLDTQPDLEWGPRDLLYTDLIRPVLEMSASNARRLASATPLKISKPKPRKKPVPSADVGAQNMERIVVKREEEEFAPVTQPLQMLVLKNPDSLLPRPPNTALKTYHRHCKSWLDLIDRLPDHDLAFLLRVVDLFSGDFEAVYEQVNYHGNDFEMIESNPDTWNSRDDKYIEDPEGGVHLEHYSVELKQSRIKYLEEVLCVNRVAAWLLTNFHPSDVDLPIQYNTPALYEPST